MHTINITQSTDKNIVMYLIQQGCNKSWPIDTEALYPCDAKG